MLGSLGNAWSGKKLNVQDPQRERHHTLTKNPKTMGLWVCSLI